MAQQQNKQGVLTIRFNADQTQALATIYPPGGDGEGVELADVLERLKLNGVAHGIREQAILDAIRLVQETARPVVDAIVAQGTLPQDGTDAKIRYTLPQEQLSQPLPRNAQGRVNWFALDERSMVKAGQEIACIVPALQGVPGKTLTMPPQTVLAHSGKPAALTAGPNTTYTEGGERLLATAEGYACLHNETLTVHALRRVAAPTQGGIHEFANGAVFLSTLTQADVRAGGFIAVGGVARGCFLRAHGDIILNACHDCTIVATGDVYVMGNLTNCQVNTPAKIIARPTAQIVGGSLCARMGITAGDVGAEDFTPTELIVDVDRYSCIRQEEIEEELRHCEKNKQRISQALKPFATLAAHTQLTEERRQMIEKLKAQRQAQEERMTVLHGERRTLLIASKTRTGGSVVVAGTAHPGAWIGIGDAALQVEEPISGAVFTPTVNGKAVRHQPMTAAAAA